MEFIKIADAVEKPRRDHGVVTAQIREWLNYAQEKTLKIACSSDKEVRTAYNVAYQLRRHDGSDFVIFRKGTDIYLVKA